MRLALLAILIIGGFASQPAHGDEEKKSDSTELIEWLLAEERDLRGIDFAQVLAATSGKKIIPLDPVWPTAPGSTSLARSSTAYCMG